MGRRAALVAVETAVLVGALTWYARAFGVRGAGFAFVVTWLTMCWLALVDKAFPLSLPGPYYELRAFERGGRLYERLGVRVAKRVLRRGPITVFNPGLHLPRTRTPEALARLDAEMRDAETCHAVLFVLVLLVAGNAAARGWWSSAAWTLLFDVVVNAYPVMLQRYNRDRLSGLRGG